MMSDMQILVWSAVLTFLMLGLASFFRNRAWNAQGFGRALGNRDDLPEPTPVAGRADRAAKNMLENLALFTALVAACILPARRARRPSSVPIFSSGRASPIGPSISPASST